MRKARPNEGWDTIARLLHWCMALFLMTQYAIGWIADGMERSPAKADMMTAHKSLGIILLLLLMLRIGWRLTHPAPPPPAGSPPWQSIAARWSHRLLYLLLAAVPLSGWLVASTSRIPWKFLWVIPWPRIAQVDKELHRLAENLHALTLWALAGLLAIHVLAALHHHFIRKDRVLSRMLKGS